MNEFIVTLITAASIEEADTIARALIDSGAAPCVNIVPSILSVYRWEGAVHRDQECLMLVKSRGDLFPRVMEIAESLHSYEVPEVIAVPLTAISERYRAYLDGFFPHDK